MGSRWPRIARNAIRAVAGAAVVALFAGDVGGQQPAAAIDPSAVRAAIERALAAVPRGFERLQSPAQAGVRLLGVAVERLSPAQQRITVDLSQRALTYHPAGDPEPMLDLLIAGTAPLAGSGHVDYRFLIDGVALDLFLSRVVPDARPRAVGTAGRVVVSAGHGWYRDELSNSWRLQREHFWGIVEDFVNHDMTAYLEAELRRAGLDVRPARQPDRNGGAGVSGHPRWQESAKYYIHDVGAPSTVWDFGADDYAKDINSRPFYANWTDSAVLVSIHNNGGGGTGTETWYDSTNGYEDDSRRLAQIVNAKIVSAIRARVDPNWTDRGVRSCNGCKGENRLANRPAIIAEAAFMDTKRPDNDALQTEAFKQIVAQAIREGLQEWGLRAPAGSDADSQARQEMTAHASRDTRFVSVLDGTFGINAGWDPSWELRWIDAMFTGGSVRIWHATYRPDRSLRFVAFFDPDAGTWPGWTRVN